MKQKILILLLVLSFALPSCSDDDSTYYDEICGSWSRTISDVTILTTQTKITQTYAFYKDKAALGKVEIEHIDITTGNMTADVKAFNYTYTYDGMRLKLKGDSGTETFNVTISNKTLIMYNSDGSLVFEKK